MKIQEVGSRGVLFAFDEPFKTNVYLIKGEKHVFVIDTFLGNAPMQEVVQYIRESESKPKPIVAFISHADYDHYWGNGCFKSSMILSHELCRKRVEEESEEQLKTFAEYKRGEVEIIPPNTVFTEKVFFVEEGVEFYHTPGHTRDSSSCFDHVDKMLFVGDNLESPFPYINDPDFSRFPSTLREYMTRNAKVILSGHADMVTDYSLVRSAIEYVEKFKTSSVDASNLDRQGKIVHFMNLSNLGDELRKLNKMKEALAYYKQGLAVLDQMPDDVQGKQEQTKRINEIMASLPKLR